MKRHYHIIIYAAVAIFVITMSLARASSINYITITVDGKALKEKALFKDSYVYVPLDAIAAATGTTSEWNPQKKRAILNGMPLKGKAYKIGTVLYVPAISAAQNLNATIKVDHKKGLVAFATRSVAIKPPTIIPTVTPTVKPTPIRTVIPTVTASVNTNEPFIPVKAENDVFKITVTNLESVNTIKGHYTPQAGKKFLVIYLSQQNVSNEVQIYTGKLALVDNGGNAYEYMEALSNFWLLVLRPGGINFGYLVFEVPSNSVPMQVVLSTTTRPPLTLNLR